VPLSTALLNRLMIHLKEKPQGLWPLSGGLTLADSKPYFIGQPKAPDGAPNVLAIMLDDGGYSSAASYGASCAPPRSI
jgi:hypothetical protein